VFFVIVVLAIIGVASLLGFTASTAFAALGALVIVPIVLFKLFLLLAILGVTGRAWHRRCGWSEYGARRPGRRHRREDEAVRPSAEDRFDEWHRMAHAKDEVDSWVPEV
jgi:hypothetical protein